MFNAEGLGQVFELNVFPALGFLIFFGVAVGVKERVFQPHAGAFRGACDVVQVGAFDVMPYKRQVADKIRKEFCMMQLYVKNGSIGFAS